MNLSRTHQVAGGPDHAWQRLSDDPVTMWSQVAETIVPYGMTGLTPAVGISAKGGLYWDNVCRQILEGFDHRPDEGFRILDSLRFNKVESRPRPVASNKTSPKGESGGGRGCANNVLCGRGGFCYYS